MLVRNNFKGIRKALVENLGSKKALSKSDFESVEEWDVYANITNSLRNAMSIWYSHNFAKDYSQLCVDRNNFFSALKLFLALLNRDSGDKLKCDSIEYESMRYAPIFERVRTSKYDNDKSMAYYDKHVKPVKEKLWSLIYNDAPKAKIDAAKEKLTEVTKAWNDIRPVAKEIVPLTEASFRRGLEVIVGKCLSNGSIKTAAQTDAERKAKRQAANKAKAEFVAKIAK